MRNTLVQIVDGDNLAHVCFHSILGGVIKDCDPDILASMVQEALLEVPSRFADMVYSCANKVKPSHGVVVFDSAIPTIRKQLYPAYKSNRPPKLFEMPLLRAQLEEFMRNLGWISCTVDSFEGDDVIASLATRLKAKDIPAVIFSSDQDLWQLLCDPLVKCVSPRDFSIATEATVLDKYGLTVAQYGDLKVLQGDAGDGIKLIEGWGLKRSTDALLKYGSLENLLIHAEEIKGKLGEALRSAPFDLCNQLTRPIYDVPLPFDNLKALEIKDCVIP